MAEDAHDHDGEESPQKGGIMGLLMKTPVLVGGAMVVEAVVLFVGMKMIGGGPDASAAALQADLEHGEVADAHGGSSDGHGGGGHGPASGDAVIQLAQVRAYNTKSGRDYLFDVSFYATVDAADSEAVTAKIQQYQPLIQDRARTIIADLDPAKLSGAEPGLETLRRKMLHEVEAILGEHTVKSLVVPSCVPFRIDF